MANTISFLSPGSQGSTIPWFWIKSLTHSSYNYSLERICSHQPGRLSRARPNFLWTPITALNPPLLRKIPIKLLNIRYRRVLLRYPCSGSNRQIKQIDSGYLYVGIYRRVALDLPLTNMFSAGLFSLRILCKSLSYWRLNRLDNLETGGIECPGRS